MCLVYSIQNMAEALDRIFSLEELEINEIEERASVPNFENLTTCSCRSNCILERGRNFCRAEVKANTVQVSATMEIRYA